MKLKTPAHPKRVMRKTGQGILSRNRSGKSKSKLLFDPTSIATQIEDCVRRDFTRDNYEITVNDATKEFTRQSQLKSTLKKFVDPALPQNRSLESEAYAKFLRFHDRARRQRAFRRSSLFRAKDGGDATFLRNQDDFYLGVAPPRSHTPLTEKNQKTYRRMRNYLVHRMARYIKLILGDITAEEVYEGAKHSSGSSIGVPYIDTSLEAKCRYPMTGTSSAIYLLNDYCRYDDVFVEALLSNDWGRGSRSAVEIVEGSRATTVDKTSTERRMICVEPTVNMFFQQGLMHVMYSRLRDIGIDLAYLPTLHRTLACYGSITGKLATIDFSSASDTIPLALVEEIFPPNWRWWMLMSRSPVMKIPGVDEPVPLVAYATMGNATTFPVETLVFLALMHAVADEADRSALNQCLDVPRLRTLNDPITMINECMSVFGDDCILPSQYAKCFMYFAETLGFVVNREKSFFTPSAGFRESCGGDYLHGVSVRPFFLKGPSGLRKLDLEAWIYKTWNLALKKYIPYFGPCSYLYDRRLFTYLVKLSREFSIKIKIVPRDFPDDSGLKIFSDLNRWLEAYPDMRLSQIGYDEHGTYHFSYLAWKFKSKKRRCDALRYAVWLKKPTVSRPRVLTGFVGDEDANHWYNIRRNGGYVVVETSAVMD